MTMFIVKTHQDPYIHTWHCVTRGHSQEEDFLHERDSVTQRWLLGRPPRMHGEVIPTLRKIWSMSDDRLEGYGSVLKPKQMDFDLYADRVRWHPVGLAAAKALAKEPSSEFHPVNLVHGDATLCNFVVGVNGTTTAIDPGQHRGLCCREIDEAKLLQTDCGWDYIRHNQCSPLDRADAYFEIRRVHQLLLITHFVRLLRHPHTHDALELAEACIRQLSAATGL